MAEAETITIEELVEKLIPIGKKAPEISEKKIEMEYNVLLSELVELLNERRNEGVKEGNIERALASEMLKKKLYANCAVIRRKAPYREFLKECIPSVLEGHTLKDTQKAMVKCAEIWNKMPEQERKKYEKNGYEIAVFY